MNGERDNLRYWFPANKLLLNFVYLSFTKRHETTELISMCHEIKEKKIIFREVY